jgi:N-acetylglucosaminyldiphosphoundecaprenol N-acetyl-beta-D-mannosaminyltransferase
MITRDARRAAPPAAGDATAGDAVAAAWCDLPEYHLLGIRVHAMRREDLLAALERAAASPAPCIIANHNLHSVYLHRRDAELRAFYRSAGCTFVDGMPIIGVARVLGLPLRREHRQTSVDWLRPALALAQGRGWRVFALGSAPAVVDRAVAALRAEFPALRLRGHHGYFDATPGSADNEAVVAAVNEYAPHLLLVGMGMPRQEHWIAREAGRLRAGAVLNLGAFLDYVAGAQRTPPRWLAAVGLEWLGRLWDEPRRLWPRYLVEPWSLVPLLLGDLVAYRLPSTARAPGPARRPRPRDGDSQP